MFTEMGTPSVDVMSEEWRRAARDWFTDHLAASGVMVAVAHVHDGVVSCAVGEVTHLIPGPSTPSGLVGLLSNVATSPDHRGHGWATRCTDTVIEWFEHETQVDRIDLFATPAGARMYSARGFVESRFPAMRRRLTPEPRR